MLSGLLSLLGVCEGLGTGLSGAVDRSLSDGSAGARLQPVLPLLRHLPVGLLFRMLSPLLPLEKTQLGDGQMEWNIV